MFYKKMLPYLSALLIVTLLTGCDYNVLYEPINPPDDGNKELSEKDIEPIPTDDGLGETSTGSADVDELLQENSSNADSNVNSDVTIGNDGLSVQIIDNGEDIRIYDEVEEFGLFLSNEAGCKIMPHNKNWVIDFDENKEYTLSGLISNSENQYFYADNATVAKVYYAYIDCGLDGNKDLAICLEYPDAESQTEYYIFTLQDGIIYLSDVEYSYYVYFTDLLDTGFISYSGRENAVVHFFGYGFVNSEGNYVFDYEIYEQAALSEPAIPSDFIINDFEGYGDFFDYDGQYLTDVYNFTTFEYDEDDVSTFEDSYNEYKKNNMFTFYDYSGNNVEPSDELKKFYKENNIVWYHENEMESIVAEHEREIGLSDNIKKGNPVQWILLYE